MSCALVAPYNGRVDTAGLAPRLARFFDAHRHDVAAAYLFGSHAAGTATRQSDVDIAVLYKQPPPSRLDGGPFDLAGLLERELGCAVDLVLLNAAPVDLRVRVLRNGILFFESDASKRIAFEIATRNEAFDLEPALRRYRRGRSPQP